MPAKRILYCESNADGTIGGSFFSLLFLIQGLDRERYEPVVIFYKDNSLIPSYRASGIDTRVLEKPLPWNFVRSLASAGGIRALCSRLLWPVQKALNVGRFLLMPVADKYLYLKRNHIDLVHLNNSIIRNNDWMIAARLAGIPCLTHERGINAHYPQLSRWLAPRLDAVICISNAVANNLRSKAIPDKNFQIIFNGLDPANVVADETDSEIRARYGIALSDPVTGMVGNIKEWKGQKSVVLAIARVKQHFPDIRCFLVGDTADADQPYRDVLEQLIEEHGLQKNIIFTGYQTNVANFVSTMDVVIHSSVLPEPFGRVLIEAMALKKPLVGARDGAVPEIVLEGETGFTFEPDNPDEMSACIVSLLQNPDQAKTMGGKGYQRLNEHFSIGSNVEKTRLLYDEILARRSS
ncbi:hypothetical protein MNBD_GAMMA15-657 [hydrothermal vent metagenome]|uniref:Glycosyltransferase n=1 Tax=hydrothermal vent metagenome TaxID=652676 RepID=A0A3B0YA81_9ZZZZ